MNPFELLSKGIVAQACKDYYDYIWLKHAQTKKNKDRIYSSSYSSELNRILRDGLEARNFLISEWCKELTDIDGYKMIREIESRAKFDIRHHRKTDFRLCD